MEFTDYQGWRMFIDAVQIFAIAILWVNNKSKVTADSVAKWEHSVNDRIDENQKQLVKIETQMRNMPEYKNIETVKREIHDVDTKVSEFKGELKTINRTMERIENYLLNKKEGCNGK